VNYPLFPILVTLRLIPSFLSSDHQFMLHDLPRTLISKSEEPVDAVESGVHYEYGTYIKS